MNITSPYIAAVDGQNCRICIFSDPRHTVYCVLCTATSCPKTFGVVPARLLGTQQKRTQHPVQGLENACGVGRAVTCT